MTVPLTTLQAFSGVLTNTRRMVANQSQKLLQNPEGSKQYGVIAASALLVVSRMMVSNYSAVKAIGTDKAAFRRQEAIRTNIREVGGFCSSFGLVLLLAPHFKWLIDKRFGISDGTTDPLLVRLFSSKANVQKSTEDGLLKQFGKSIATLWTKKAYQVKSYTPKLSELPSPFECNLAKFETSFEGQSLTKIVHWFDKTVKPEVLLKRYRELTPYLLATPFTLLVSGVLLEIFTREHSKDVVAFISKALGGDTKNSPKPPAASTPTPVATLSMSQSFAMPNTVAASPSPFAASPSAFMGVPGQVQQPMNPFNAPAFGVTAPPTQYRGVNAS